MDQQIPVDVRAADQTIFSDIMQGTPMKSDIRDQFPEDQRDFVTPIMQEFEAGMDLGSPQFEGEQLFSMIQKIDSKQVFGEKTFDFADEIEEAPVVAASIPKDQKRRENFLKQLITQDERLGAKVAKVRTVRNQEEIPIEM